MITVLLVDDNRIALKHFANVIDWNSLGFSIAGEAINGIDALRKFEQFQPDVVITDIQMPGMDGMELAHRIRASVPDTVIIFLSSYDEFDYARTAIDLNVHEYILKHEVNRQIMSEKMAEIRAMIEKRDLQRYKLLDQQFYLGFHSDSYDINNAIQHYDDFVDGDFCFFILEQDHIPQPIVELSEMQVSETNYRSIIPAILADSPTDMHLIRFEPYRWVGLYPTDDSIHDIAQHIKLLAENISGVSFSLFLYHIQGSISDCRKHYEKYRFLFEQKYFEHPGNTFYTDLYEHSRNTKNMAYFNGKEVSCLLFDNPEIFDRQIQAMVLTYDYANIMQVICSCILAMKEKIEKNRLNVTLFDEEAMQLLTIRRCIRWIKKKSQLLSEVLNPEYSDFTNKAIYFISQCYSDPFLGLEDIAMAAGISVNRLNEIFKKELHQTVGRYLTRIRMEKAREILSNPQVRIPDAARLSGYSSSSYFSYVFRKTWGLTPQAYKNCLNEK